MSNLTIRILFAVIAIPVTFLLLWLNDISRLALMCFLSGAGAWEWARMASKMYKGPSMQAVAPVAAVALTLAWIFQSGKFFGIPALPHLVGIVFVCVFAFYIVIAFSKVSIDHLFPWLAMQLGAPLYLGLWGGLDVYLLGSGNGSLEHSYKFILVMTAMWVCDTMAYFGGRLLGKHRIAPEISPKKTWEGAVCGTLFAIGWVMFFAPSVFGLNDAMSAVLGIVLAIAGQVGDLLESTLKRWSGTKDASQIFPGHGGVLDRADSFFLSAPAVVLVMTFINGSV